MLIEKIIFTILATYLIITMFFKFIKKIDKIYVSILVMQLLGIVLKLIEIIFVLHFNIIIQSIIYLISVIIPIIIIIMESRGKNLSEFLYMLLAKFYQLTR